MSEPPDLRSLLRAADQSKHSGADFSNRMQDRSLHELASLIGAIEADDERNNKRPSNTTRQTVSTSHRDQNRTSYSSVKIETSLKPGLKYGEGHSLPPTTAITREDLLSDSDYDYESNPPDPLKAVDLDSPDHIVIKFQTNYLIRGKYGKYLTAYKEDAASQRNPAVQPSLVNNSDGNKANSQPTMYLLGTEGLGVGDAADCITFLNVDNKDDNSPIKYGQVIAIKSLFAKERLLGLRDGVKLGFWRHLIGQGEKWQILKACSPSSTSMGVEDSAARGKYVRLGEIILIQTYKADHILSVYEKEARLIYRERTSSLSAELWQVELFAAVPLPLWCLNRPYLSGKYLVMPQTSRMAPPEMEARAFPRVAGGESSPASPPTLSSLSGEMQQSILMREILLLFMGIEGNYIRIAAASANSSPTSVPSTSAPSTFSNPLPTLPPPLPSLRSVKLVMDVDSADKSIALKISTLFPMCEQMIRIKHFLTRQSRYEYGLCSHALVAELNLILKDFYVLVAQLEYLLNQGKLTLQKFIYLLYPSSKVLYTLDVVCSEVHEQVGGQMLNSLYSLYLAQGDSENKLLCERLLEKASVPYLHMISQWVFRGKLVDNYLEFMLVEDKSIDKEALREDFNASYWDNKYTIVRKHVVSFLHIYVNKILVCGKYLHIVRDCLGDTLLLSDMTVANNKVLLVENGEGDQDKQGGEKIELPIEIEVVLDIVNHHASILSAVDYSYGVSSQTLLSILIHKYGLYKHLASLHKYFLLKQGDFFIQFMDISETELKKDVKEIILNKLQSLLYQAIQSSTLMHDDHKDKLTCTLASHNLIQHLHLIQMAGEQPGNAFHTLDYATVGLKGIEAFTLDYLVTFPLSIVLSRRVITKYQLLSRLIYFSKHVERRLLSCWMFQQASRDCLHVRGVMGAAYTLRHRMLHFMQNFVYYITFEVIHPHEHQLTEDLKHANDMDKVMELHEKFLDTCLKECLLASQDLLKVLTKLMTTCLLFGDHMARFMNEATSAANSSQELIVTQTNPPSTKGNRLSASFRKSPGHNSSQKDVKDFNDKDDANEVARQKVAAKLESILSRRKQRVEKKSDYILREAGHESFVRILNKFADTFDSQLKEFLDTLWNNSYRHHVQLANLCVRLDYNGFYSSQFAPPF